VISASANTETIIEHAGLADLLDCRIDGAAMRAGSLLAKPEPDTIIAACNLLGLRPAETAAFETTPAGVMAAKTAGCGLIVGVDRTGDAPALLAAGAEKVVSDLGALLRVSADRAATNRR
jgi:beta-phosphoglucomutase-like phosphatase (HAD superfamily)